jgi:alkanesulfonate monooxygenase SsuD/methylene tetrahydromethanopterin reductase-like flavin-dependent oxidoreductase (luciferase family)
MASEARIRAWCCGGGEKHSVTRRVCESIEPMELGVHLPLMEFGDEGQSLGRLQATVDAAGRSGFVAVSANDHFVFSTPWLDGLTALAAVMDRTGEMTLATTISLAALRGPVPLAKALAALDVLSDGRLVAGVGPGSSDRDYNAFVFGVPFDDRWKRFEEAVRILRALLRKERAPQPTRYFAARAAAPSNFRTRW